MNKAAVMLLAVVLALSVSAVARQIYLTTEAQTRLSEVLELAGDNYEISDISIPNVDDQILLAQRKLTEASSEITKLKDQIGRHAIEAKRRAAESSINAAQRLMDDIALNSALVLEKNQEIQSELITLYSLYNRKIEKILAAKQVQEEARFGIAFWVGLFGVLGSLSGVIVAWRKDNLDHRKDFRELLELKSKLATT